ncbi:MAG: DUF1552 domain-containing protein [Gemmataceae bacterium]
MGRRSFTIAWRLEQTYGRVSYNELFRSVTNSSAVESDNVLLDYWREQEGRRLKGLDGIERTKICSHVASIQATRARNEQVAALADVISENLPTINRIHKNGGLNASIVEKQEAFTEVLISALITGLTNVVTYTIDDLSTPITTLTGNTSRIRFTRWDIRWMEETEFAIG